MTAAEIARLRALASNWRAFPPTDRGPSYILDDLCPQVLSLLSALESARKVCEELTAARDEACDLSFVALRSGCDRGALVTRISELRKVGGK